MANKVLVVGGAGYIGSHVAKALHRAGHSVMVFDDLSTGFRELAKYGEFTLGSILESEQVEAVLNNFKPDAVMHFAARAAVGESVENPALYYSVNVEGAFKLLEGIRKFSPKTKVVFSSTCAVYGEVSGKLDESLPLLPVNPYGRTKKIIEEMLSDYSHAYGISYTSLRYFNAAGADSEGELGELHDPETHLIPRILLKLLRSDFGELKIFGNDYPTQDGTCVRDYIHVEDLARAHLLAMDRLLAGGNSEIYNLGTERGSSVLEAIHMVEKVTGRKVPVQRSARRIGDPATLIASSAKIQKALGWKPKHDLESIIQSAWKWAQSRN